MPMILPICIVTRYKLYDNAAVKFLGVAIFVFVEVVNRRWEAAFAISTRVF